jgi:hypothetical protein
MVGVLLAVFVRVGVGVNVGVGVSLGTDVLVGMGVWVGDGVAEAVGVFAREGTAVAAARIPTRGRLQAKLARKRVRRMIKILIRMCSLYTKVS